MTDAGSRRPTWLSLPERRPATLLAIIGTLFALAYASSLVLLPKPDGRVVIGDAVHYFVYLRSVVFDGDLQFRNEYVRLYGLKGGEAETEWVYEPTATGHTRNLMSVGPALLWAPLFLATTALVWLAGLLGAPVTLDGYGRLFQASAGLSGIAAATIGACITCRLAARRFGPRSAIWATLTVWLGSSALYYSLISPTYSHAASMLTSSVFVMVWLRTRDEPTVGASLFLGALGGACALVRWQDAVLLAGPAVDLLVRGHGVRVASAMRPALAWTITRGLALMAGALIAISPQLFVWVRLYGSPLLVPQGEAFMRWTAPALGPVLFSDNHGLFSWTPILLVAVAGLLVLARRDRRLGGALLLIFALSWYANAAAADWWAGEAFGARRFVSLFPIFSLGLAAVVDACGARLRLTAATAVVVIVLNGLLLLQYQTFMRGWRDVAPYPSGAYGLWLARFVVPFNIVERARESPAR